MKAQISQENCEILITAEEAYRAFERAVLAAKDEIRAGFHVFDLMTQLHDAASLKIGETWFDLLAHKLDQGVRFSLKLADFDPVAGADYHANTWRTIRQACALREVVQNPDLLTVKPCMHPARIGWLASVGLWPKARGLVADHAKTYNKMGQADQALFRREHPGLLQHLQFDAAGKAKARHWPPARLVPATHHQKIAVIDGRQVYVGGLDLNDRRYDTKRHNQPAESTWHDVQLLIEDEALAASVETHLDDFDTIRPGQRPPTAATPPFVRTLSTARKRSVVSLAPDPRVDEIRVAHLNAIAAAKDLIYLETQFLRDKDITDALVTAHARRPNLGVVVILPAAPEDVAFEGATGSDARYGEHLQAECVEKLQEALGPQIFFGSPVRPRRNVSEGRDTLHNAPVLYVHAKVSIFDDEKAMVSSANLNGRSMKWDTEAGVELTDPALVRHLKQRCIRHWMPNEPLAPYLGGPDAPNLWLKRAESAAKKAPEDRETFILPYTAAPAKRFGKNLPGVPEEMV